MKKATGKCFLKKAEREREGGEKEREGVRKREERKSENGIEGRTQFRRVVKVKEGDVTFPLLVEFARSDKTDTWV